MNGCRQVADSHEGPQSLTSLTILERIALDERKEDAKVIAVRIADGTTRRNGATLYASPRSL